MNAVSDQRSPDGGRQGRRRGIDTSTHHRLLSVPSRRSCGEKLRERQQTACKRLLRAEQGSHRRREV